MVLHPDDVESDCGLVSLEGREQFRKSSKFDAEDGLTLGFPFSNDGELMATCSRKDAGTS
jgi:hypothetical protein